MLVTGGLTEKAHFFHFLCEFHLLPPEGLSTLDLIFNMHSNEFELVLGLTQLPVVLNEACFSLEIHVQGYDLYMYRKSLCIRHTFLQPKKLKVRGGGASYTQVHTTTAWQCLPAQ